MKKLYFGFAILIIVGTNSCAPRIELAAERAAIFETDKMWSKASVAKNVDVVLSFFTDDASMFPPNATVLTGKEAIRSFVSETFSDPYFSVSWQANQVEVSRAGDLGYTFGTIQFIMNSPELVIEHGKYVTIWEKQADRQWKAVADIWNLDQPTPGPA